MYDYRDKRHRLPLSELNDSLRLLAGLPNDTATIQDPTYTAPLTLLACSPAVLTYRMYDISGHHYSGALVAFKIQGEEDWTGNMPRR